MPRILVGVLIAALLCLGFTWCLVQVMIDAVVEVDSLVSLIPKPEEPIRLDPEPEPEEEPDGQPVFATLLAQVEEQKSRSQIIRGTSPDRHQPMELPSVNVQCSQPFYPTWLIATNDWICVSEMPTKSWMVLEHEPLLPLE